MSEHQKRARDLLNSEREVIVEELLNRVEIHIRFMETVNEGTLVPLKSEEMEVMKVGALLGIQAYKELLNDANITMLRREEADAMTKFIKANLKQNSEDDEE